MSLKLISVRIPESMHTYLKIKAAKDQTSVQELVTQSIGEYQAKDTDYQNQLNQSVTDSLTALAQLTAAQDQAEVSHGL